MNHRQIYGQRWRYPTAQAMNPCSQHVVEEAVLVYSQKKSTHEQQHGNHRLYEHLPYMYSKLIYSKRISKFMQKK